MAVRLGPLAIGRPVLCEWFEEHGLDPYYVAMEDGVWPLIDGDSLTVHLYGEDRNEDPATGKPKTTVRTVALRRPLPDVPRLDNGEALAGVTIPA